RGEGAAGRGDDTSSWCTLDLDGILSGSFTRIGFRPATLSREPRRTRDGSFRGQGWRRPRTAHQRPRAHEQDWFELWRSRPDAKNVAGPTTYVMSPGKRGLTFATVIGVWILLIAALSTVLIGEIIDLGFFERRESFNGPFQKESSDVSYCFVVA